MPLKKIPSDLGVDYDQDELVQQNRNELDFAEKHIIATCLQQNESVDDIRANLQPFHFRNKIAQIFYEQILALNEDNNMNAINDVSLLNQLRTTKEFLNDQNRFLLYLNQINEISYYYSYVHTSIRIVKNAYIKDELDLLASKILKSNIAISNSKNSYDQWLSDFRTILLNQDAEKIDDMRTITKNYYEKMMLVREKGHNQDAIFSGYRHLDKMTNGFKPGQLIVLAARAGMGKTSFALNIIKNNITKIQEYNASQTDEKMKKIILFFSLEMNKSQILDKLAALETNMIPRKFYSKNISNADYQIIDHAMEKLMDYPLQIGDQNINTINSIESQIYDLHKRKKIALVVIDYLQLISSERKNNQSRAEQVAKVSNTLKRLSLDLNIPIIAVAQLSRAAETNKPSAQPQTTPWQKSYNNQIPQQPSLQPPLLSDLKESGAIEQDADSVIFIYYDRYQQINFNSKKGEEANIDVDDDGNNMIETHVLLAKNRDGPTGQTNIVFQKNIGKFHDK
ncbi:AAA family ATPase [Ureaplasma sp. ES3154-GEN]|uniref:DnaB-like helicase C-terminal domain-containing protein n=1 Tax=Ureaplasma sp. ES3154-GEN TaxID=2984844 RepID=UPI0021E7F1CF|nr:DnaB-like helicase C-terminal domain-containing protein [Ureaplasma sp. ES3154-GEN]MCV3743730.1 AAA family ATPase [Ureaplasma sp. ES3154-GEN]